MSSIETRLEQERDWISWVPGGDTEKYDTRNPIVGKLVDQATITGGQYGDARVMILEADDGTRIGVWLNRTVLKNEIAEKNPQWGERVGIKHLGEVTPAGGGAAYHSYKVAVDRPMENRAPVSWGDSPDPEPVLVVYPQVGTSGNAGVSPGQNYVASAPQPFTAADDDIPF